MTSPTSSTSPLSTRASKYQIGNIVFYVLLGVCCVFVIWAIWLFRSPPLERGEYADFQEQDELQGMDSDGDGEVLILEMV